MAVTQFLETSDNVKVAYDFYQADKPVGYLVLVHMMPAVKDSWEDFAKLAQQRGLSSIALDLRGHGESDGGPNGFLSFSDEDHQKSILDLDAAAEFLKQQGALPHQIGFVGASIGANLALQFIVRHPNFKFAVLLSPGLNYRGIEAEPLIRRLSKDQKIMLVAARDDGRAGGNNAAMNEKLAKLIPADVAKEPIIYDTGGHGTMLLKAHPDLTGKILEFLKL